MTIKLNHHLFRMSHDERQQYFKRISLASQRSKRVRMFVDMVNCEWIVR